MNKSSLRLVKVNLDVTTLTHWPCYVHCLTQILVTVSTRCQWTAAGHVTALLSEVSIAPAHLMDRVNAGL